jgi:glycogen debranching enzyme
VAYRPARWFTPLLLSAVIASPASARPADTLLAARILNDTVLTVVLERAKATVGTGLTAGEAYCEVWIRDLCTFLELALQVHERGRIREALKTFFLFQQPDGGILDGYAPDSLQKSPYRLYRIAALPRTVGHKNTVETDQETSLVQAVARYIRITRDSTFLREVVDGKTIMQRMDDALMFLVRNRTAEQYGLLWGATTVDWGDVQPGHRWGVEIDSSTRRSVDIYDNAMFVIALEEYVALLPPEDPGRERWTEGRRRIISGIRQHLWDGKKYRPHIYLEGSPFPPDFDENAIMYFGGTAVAIEAGLLTMEEISSTLERMRKDVQKAGATSIGLSVYPPYPEGVFRNKQLVPWSYQNGGDWTWFGARLVRALIKYWLIADAYRELEPMAARALRDGGFYEWYTVGGEPRGSGTYRGAAGMLGMAIEDLRAAVR